jgi:Ca-activated chloride channel family protein
MEWLWPRFLLLLGIIPLLVGIYIWILRRRRRFAVRYSSLSLVRAALPQQSRWRRHIPFALFLLGLSSLMLAVSRPVAVMEVPSGKTIIILAMDISRSMCSTDIPPNRLMAAEKAALSFVRGLSPSTQMGIVVFAGFAELIQPPTGDQEILEAAITGLSTARRTAIGSGVLRSIDAIAESDESVAPIPSSPATDLEASLVPEEDLIPHIIILLTDGASNTGPDPLDAAQQAALRGIRVYTIGFGTPQGGPFALCDQSFGEQSFFGGGGGFGGGGFRRGIDEDTLMQIADLTSAEYYAASSASELEDVFRNLPISIITRRETLEISVIFTAIGALLAAAAVVLSQAWHPLL